MLSGANCLLLDEPTNHLDIESMEVLESALESYDGTVIVISHDRYLLDRIPDRIVEVRDGAAFSSDRRLRRLGGRAALRMSGDAARRDRARRRRVPRLSPAGRVARGDGAREGRALRRPAVLGPAGAGLRRPGRPDRDRWGSRRPRTAGTAPAGSSPATGPATSCTRRCIASGFANQPDERRAGTTVCGSRTPTSPP